MLKFKKFLTSKAGKATLLLIGLSLLSIILLRATQKHDISKIAKNLQQSKASPVHREVHYTTEETLKTLMGETDNVKFALESLARDLASLKGDMKTNQKNVSDVSEQVATLKHAVTHNDKRIINTENDASSLVWIKDTVQSSSPLQQPLKQALLAQNKTITATPEFTIPQNTWLTGAIALQPLVGIIPVNGQVMNPHTVSFTVGAENLAANDWHLPAVLQGMQGSAICEGFFAVKRPAVTCKVTSLTFIFEDGTINTVNGKAEDPLGIVTDFYGNPHIAGTLYSNLGYFLAGNAFFSGLQGYGGALSAAQMQTTTGVNAPGFATVIGNANTYAAGQGLSTAARDANSWWMQRMKSTFDYVEVPNWNSETHELLQLNINITKPINIDHDEIGRRVDYANSTHASINNNLD